MGMKGYKFNPQRLRHIYVTERLEAEEDAPGPSHEGAALAMGNSVRQWAQSYQLNRDQAKIQKAVNKMPAWRESMLAQAAQLNR